MQIIVSETFSPSFNLASEHYLLTERPCDVLFFYINAPGVILGRNQNIFAEANLPFCNENGIALVRRLSGGGAVYHDHGNINFCFLTCQAVNPLDFNPLYEIEHALGNAGIKTTVGTRKDLYILDKKISGTAIHCRGNQVLFHGTLLYDVNLQQLETALSPSFLSESKAVKSIRSKVGNIREEIPAMQSTSTYAFLEYLTEYFSDKYHTQPIPLSQYQKEKITEIEKEKYLSWQWNWAQNPKANIIFPYQQYKLALVIDKGIITEVDKDCPQSVRKVLLNKKFTEIR